MAIADTLAIVQSKNSKLRCVPNAYNMQSNFNCNGNCKAWQYRLRSDHWQSKWYDGQCLLWQSFCNIKCIAGQCLLRDDPL